MKYHTRAFFSDWNIIQALYDNFPELKAVYSIKKNIENYILHVLEPESSKDCHSFLVYYDWLIENFPFEKAYELSNQGGEKEIWDMAVYAWSCACSMIRGISYEDAQVYYQYLLKKQRVFDLFFKTKWTNCDKMYLSSFYALLLYHKDYEFAKKTYLAMLENGAFFVDDDEKDEYLENMIGWEHHHEQHRQGQQGPFFTQVQLCDEAYEFFMDLVNSLPFPTPKSRQKLKNHAPDYSADAIENEIADLEFEIQGLIYKKSQLQKRLEKLKR